MHRAGTERPMQDSNHNNIDDPTLSLWEKLAIPEYPLFILVKLLLMQHKFDDAIWIVITMEAEAVLDFAVLYQVYKLLFQYFLDADNGRLFFDRSGDVPVFKSSHETFFPRAGRSGIHILAQCIVVKITTIIIFFSYIHDYFTASC
jgi:hypothetical protein